MCLPPRRVDRLDEKAAGVDRVVKTGLQNLREQLSSVKSSAEERTSVL